MDALAPLLGGVPRTAPSDLADRAAALVEGATCRHLAQDCWGEVADLVRAHPGEAAPQIAAAQILELQRGPQSLAETWIALHRRFPQNRLALRMALRWLGREGRGAEGMALFQAACPRPATTADALVEEAALLAELRDHAQATARFESAIAIAPEAVKPRVAYARSLFARDKVWEAGRVLADLPPGARLTQSAREMCREVTNAVKAARAVPQTYLSGDAVPSAALGSAIALFARRPLPPRVGTALGGVVMLTGSLGSGGAERQMTRMAIALHQARAEGRAVAGTRLSGPIEVVVSHADPTRGRDFFRPDLDQAGVPLSLLREVPEADLDALGLDDATLAQLVPLLPQQTRFGLARLVPLLRAKKPEVLYIWQDGAVLMAALAGLIAGVPRLVISLRGLPPNVRPELMKDAYLPMYRALGAVPGVVFSANSAIAAREYAAWVDLPQDRFTVLPNAVDPLPTAPATDSAKLWDKFAAQTGPGFTLGTVMRFTPNKRPDLWVDSAARLLDHHPDARAIMVGGGAGVDEARARADALGITERLLLTGARADVGFWLSKMNAFLLLSQFEGLPNVLIEAQLAGVPVISTPAGGAAETFAPDITGLLLRSARSPDPNEILRAVRFLAENPDLRAQMGRFAAQDTKPRYALRHVQEQTVRLLKGLPPPDVDRAPARPRTATTPASAPPPPQRSASP